MRRALLLLVLSCGCASQAPSTRLMDIPEPPPQEEQIRLGGGQWILPASVASQIARERDDLGTFDVLLEKVPGNPTIRMMGFQEPELVDTDDASLTVIRTLLDEDVLAECIIRNDRLFLAQSFHRVSNAMERRPALSIRRMGELEHMPEGNWPVMMLRMEYLTPERQYGNVHMAATNVNDLGVFCSADAAGFSRTFRRAVTTLIESLRAAVPDTSVRRSFHWVKAEGGWTGLVESVERKRESGEHVEMQFAALLRTQQVRLRVLDEVNVEVSENDGTLKALRLLREADGEMVRDLTLAPSSSSNTHLTLRGRKQAGVEEDLGRTLTSTARELRAHYVQAIRDGAPSRTFVRYYPGVEPGALAEEKVELVEKIAKGATFRSTIRAPGSEIVEGIYDVTAEGEILKSTIRAAGKTVTLERLQ